MLRVLDLFSGIGGFSLGLDAAGGFETVAFCEIDQFCQKILKQQWPGRPIIEDVKNVTTSTLERVGLGNFDVITAGFPCQPFSAAGKQLGESDPRHLWPQVKRIISEFRPRYVLLENVPGLLSNAQGRTFGRILGDLALCGYDAEWQVLPASAFGAWHRRDRVWIVAYPTNGRIEWRARITATDSESCTEWGTISPRGTKIGDCQIIANASRQRFQETTPAIRGNAKVIDGVDSPRIFVGNPREYARWAEPGICRISDGIPDRSHRIKALGNAVVPPIVAWIGGQILIDANAINRKAA